MNVTQLHLMLNHFPIVGLIAAFSLLMYTLWRPSREVRNVALAGIALSGLMVLPVLLTGNASEDLVERLPGVREALIQAHESAAEVAGVLALVAGAAALLTFALQRWAPRFAKEGLAATLVLALVATVSIGWSAHLGGEIRHPEAALAWNAAGQSGEAGEGAASSLLPGGGPRGNAALSAPAGTGRARDRDGDGDND
jgi:Predicted membrane protein (DUF2231)